MTWWMMALAIASAPAAERVVSSDGIVDATIAGTPARLRLSPGAASIPCLNGDFPERARLKHGMLGTAFLIGPVKVMGATALTRIDLGAGEFKRRVTWFKQPCSSDSDATIGPGGLPDPVVRFVLHAPLRGETNFTLPMADSTTIFGTYDKLSAMIDVGGVPVRVSFDTHHRTTLATAGAGVAIAAAFGGTMEGATDSLEIAFGVERPVRTMRLKTPLVLGSLSIVRLRVRVADFGTTAGIAESDAKADPNEIVVTAKGKRKRQHDSISLGLDQLERCSSIVFDKPAKQIRLSCL